MHIYLLKHARHFCLSLRRPTEDERKNVAWILKFFFIAFAGPERNNDFCSAARVCVCECAHFENVRMPISCPRVPSIHNFTIGSMASGVSKLNVFRSVSSVLVIASIVFSGKIARQQSPAHNVTGGREGRRSRGTEAYIFVDISSLELSALESCASARVWVWVCVCVCLLRTDSALHTALYFQR